MATENEKTEFRHDLSGINISRAQAAELGKSLRDQVPRVAHAVWKTPEQRKNPVDILIETSKGRVPELLPIRYGRMLQSPFAFYRGTAAVMAADLASTPNTGLYVQACGDCHLMNFGTFASPERRIVFDINDFDETLPAPWEWDLKRLAASFVIACLHNQMDKTIAQACAAACVESYRKRTAEYADMDMLTMWYSYLSVPDIVADSDNEVAKKRFKKRLDKAAGRSVIDEDFPKLAEFKDGRAIIKDNPPLIYHYSDLDWERDKDMINDAIQKYRECLTDEKRVLFDYFRFHDFAAKVVGVGSVGTRCGISLRMTANNEPLFLQVKEARESVLEPYAGASQYKNHGQRVVNGQKLMQSATDVFLGWSETSRGNQFYVRQLRDMKVKPLVEIFDEQTMTDYAGLCGWALARAHARSGKAAIISGYIGNSSKFDEAIAQFAVDYSDQNEKDFAALQEAVKQGQIEAYFEQ